MTVWIAGALEISRGKFPPLLRRLIPVIFLAGAAAVSPGADQDARLEVGHMERGALSMDDLRVGIGLRNDGNLSLVITASALQLAQGLRLQAVEIDCAGGSLLAQEVNCGAGEFRATWPGHGDIHGQVALRHRLDGRATELDVVQTSLFGGALSAHVRYTQDGWSIHVDGKGLSLPKVRELVGMLQIWPEEYSDASGTFDLAAGASGLGGVLRNIDGTLHLHQVGFNGPDGAENLSAELVLHAAAIHGWDVQAQGKLEEGILYVEPGLEIGGIRPGLALEVVNDPISLAIDFNWDPGTGALDLRRAELDHPGVVTAHAGMRLHRGETIVIDSLAATAKAADAGALYQTYLQPFLLGTPFNDMEIAGAVDARVELAQNEVKDLALDFADVHAYDGSGRFSVAGLHGNLLLHEGAEPLRSTLRWDGIGIYRLNLGGGELVLESRDADVQVIEWADVDILDGVLRIDSLSVTNAGKRNMRIALDGGISAISMADLTQVLDWPVMSGTLTGSITGLTYQFGDLSLDGRIDVDVFGGHLELRDLAVDKLFGLVPVLRANVDVENIDLERLTDRFSFGRIEGRLEGYIHRLELQAWRPVYFESLLRTPADDHSRHRISQQAVDNLGYLGSGATGALSSGFLRFFKDYSYGELGISCRLYNGSCEMGGVADTPDGFLILTRGGLMPPWIEVKGTGRSIPWQVLIDGFRTIAANRAEIR